MFFKVKNQFQTLMLIGFFLAFSCKKNTKESTPQNAPVTAPEGMVWVAPKTFLQGAKKDDAFAMPKEVPAHNVKVDGFFMDITEVTNKQFRTFVETTDYVTVAERPIDWNVMKKDLPPNSFLTKMSMQWLTCKITVNGGHGKSGPIGSIRQGQIQTLMEWMIILLFMLPTKTHWLIVSGQTGACPQKPSGKLQLKEPILTPYLPGEMTRTYSMKKRIPGKVYFL